MKIKIASLSYQVHIFAQLLCDMFVSISIHIYEFKIYIMSKSTAISDIPDSNNELVQQVLDEVELSKQESERSYSNDPMGQLPFMQPIQTQQPMNQNPMNQNPMGQFNMQNLQNMQNMPFMLPQNNQQMGQFNMPQYDDNDNLFLGFTLNHIKNTVIVLILFTLLHMPFTTSILEKYLSFMTEVETGNITIVGICIKALVCAIIFLIISRFI